MNNHSGRDRLAFHIATGIPIHIAPESLFTISRNAYSHCPESALKWCPEVAPRMPSNHIQYAAHRTSSVTVSDALGLMQSG